MGIVLVGVIIQIYIINIKMVIGDVLINTDASDRLKEK
jgi:hypothetical protein